VSTALWGVEDLVVDYRSRRALDGVTLAIPAGAVTAVVGGDGAGKTTLLRAMVGGVRPTSGSVRRPAAERVGSLSGSAGVYGDLTVGENLAFAGGAYGVRGEELRARSARLLAATGLQAAATRLAGRLSGGMRQKLAFAMATLHEPELLVLDEPTTGVDPVSRADLWRLLAGAAAAGAAVLFSTTYSDEAERAGDVLVLDAGRTLLSGPPDAVVAALPGLLCSLAGAPTAAQREHAWRRGRGHRYWSADGSLPAGAAALAPDLADAVVVGALAGRRSPAAVA
jgi:ABC-2 type transport system ATP-binding protein